MNNKGFAITTVLYGIFILFLMLLMSLLGMLSTYKNRLGILIENTNGTRDIINSDNSCIVFYDVNGGIGEIEPQKVPCGSNIIITDVKPTKDNNVFLGWDLDKDAICATYHSGDELTVDQVMVLYAIWSDFNPINSYNCENKSSGSEPYNLTYTGNCEMIDDGDGN